MTMRLALPILMLLLARAALAAEPMVRITVDHANPGPAVSPVMYGVFFEDINYGADGGLYAELVENRSFEHKDPLHAWETVRRDGADGDVRIETDRPLNANNPHYARIDVRAPGQGCGVANAGYGGIAVKAGERYLLSVRARAAEAGTAGALWVRLEDGDGHPLGDCRIDGLRPAWHQYDGVITSGRTSANARLVVLATMTGSVDLDVVSLFPENTFNGRRNGLRADLAEAVKDLRPGFVRFPGGCIVEGNGLANAYRWKDTIGDVAERKQNWNLWQNRQSPQYHQTYGLGFFEYFQFCEDVGAEPVPILNCGMACQARGREMVPLEELGPWVQDALDLVEFATGPADSTWGARRAAMGHPEPFKLNYLGIGNEQWGEDYFPRYDAFHKALKAKHSHVQLITTSGPGVDDRWWDLAWGKFRSGTPADIVDEHYYRPPTWFLDQVDRYAAYDRNGAKVFVGEYAAHGPRRRNDWRAALSEAAYMTGLLRNADVVVMTSYAPLFARHGSVQWSPDLIWFDDARVYPTPSYHVQALFSRNRPDVVLPVTIEGARDATPTFPGRVGVGTWRTQAEFKDVVVTAADGRTLFASDFSRGTDGWETGRGQWEAADGALRQSSNQTNTFAVAGDPSWADYTLSLKARKLGGDEGFLIRFEAEDADARCYWNIGGWGNTRHGLEMPGVPEVRVDGRVETDRWYDVRVELRGASIKCYLDGQLVHDVTRKAPPPAYAVAGIDRQRGETVLTVVNVSGDTVDATVNLAGADVAPGEALETQLAAEANAENTPDTPDAVAPRERTIPIGGGTFGHAFPPRSATVLRMKTSR